MGFSNWVGWQVTQIDIIRLNGANPDSVWEDHNPEFNSTENLWWVEHTFPNSPVLDEFSELPYTTRTAEVVSNATDDLSYELETEVPSGQFSYNYWIMMHFAVKTPIEEEEPIESGADEPVQVQ